MKLTKNCLYPWRFLQVHAGGMVQCCAVGNDTDLGDLIIDHCQKIERGEYSDVLNSPGLQALRHGLLTGNLRPMCRKCFFVDDRPVSTDFLRQRLMGLLRNRLPEGTDLESLDLTRVHAYEEIAISFTNKCNLRCVYCVQSVHGNSNPYFKMDFPSQYAADVLEFFAAQGIVQLRTCVEGEPTIYSKWHEVFSRFHARHPHIKLRMTTNLSRPYTDEEIEFLTQYSELDISCDTLDPVLYAKLRRGGRLELVLENIRRVCEKADALKVRGPFITLHAVVSDATWSGLEDLTDYALANGYLVLFGNYEERFNTVAFRENICRPLGQMTREEQVEAQKCFQRILLKLRGLTDAQRDGHAVEDFFQGNLLYNLDANVAMDYNHFKPYDSNPLHSAFFKQYPLGKNYMHLDIVYDYDNISYSGVLFLKPVKLELHGFFAAHVVVREVLIFKKGKCSSKYDSVVLPGYRKTIKIENDYFVYEPKFGEDVDKVLLEISEYW